MAGVCISCEIALRWMSLNLTDDESPLVQVMAWCRQVLTQIYVAIWHRYKSQYIGHRKIGHCSDAIMSAMASQITGVSIVYSIVCSGADQREQQSSASLAFVRGIHRRVTRKMFPFDDVIMIKSFSFSRNSILEFRFVFLWGLSTTKSDQSNPVFWIQRSIADRSLLIQRDLNKKDDILQMTFSIAFSQTSFIFHSNFTDCCSHSCSQRCFSIAPSNGLMLRRR